MKAILRSMLALAIAGSPLVARQEPQDDKDKAKPEQPKKPEPKPKPEAKSKQEPQPKTEDKQQQKADKERQKQEEKQQREANRPAQQRQTPPQGRAQGGHGRGQRIPEQRFRAAFGKEHRFHVQHEEQRFQYGGFWFEVVEPWPADWVFDDDCYIDEDEDSYYLVDALHPDLRIVVVVVEG